MLPADAGVATLAAAAPAGVPSEPALSSTRLAGERAAAAVCVARAAARAARWAEAPERADLGIVKQRYREVKATERRGYMSHSVRKVIRA